MQLSYINNPIKLLLERLLALLSIILLSPLLSIFFLFCSISTKSNGIYVQNRIGKYGRIFRCFKFKTMIDSNNTKVSSISNLNYSRITLCGQLMRRYKFDELPQLFNIFLGEMSFVGPRPDVPGFANELRGGNRNLLLINPGVTSTASIFFRDEEKILHTKNSVEKYNKDYIWPLKVFLNLDYISEACLSYDLEIILATIGIFRNYFDQYLKIKVIYFILGNDLNIKLKKY